MERDRNVLFQGAIPENYDRYPGPVIFEQRLAERFGATPFQSTMRAIAWGAVKSKSRD